MSVRAGRDGDPGVVLVVDDDPDIRLLCELILGAAGHEVRTVADGASALAAVAGGTVAVAVVDRGLPDIDGVELVGRLAGCSPPVPAVMLTARTQPADEVAAYEAGVVDYLTKPFTEAELVEAVDRALGRAEARPAPAGAPEVAVLRALPDAVVVIDPGGRITAWNPAAERLFGQRESVALGAPAVELLAGSGAEALADELSAAGAGAPPATVTAPVRRPDGTETVVEAGVAPLGGGLVIVARDVTGRSRVERRLRELFASAPDALVVVDDEGRITEVNHRATELFGWPAEDLVGRPVEVLVPEALRERHARERERYQRAPRPRPMGAGRELTGRRRDGTEFPVEISLSPLGRDAGGGVAAAVRDVSERRRAETMFRGLLEAAPDAMVVVDATGTIRLANAQAERLFGWSADELVGQPVEMLVPERYRDSHRRHRSAFAGHPRVRPMGQGLELYGRRRDGTEFPVEISLSPIESDEGLLVSAAIRDVTERKRAEAALAAAWRQERAAAERLRELDRMRTDFLSTVSHELRTPLTAIRGFADLLARRGETLDPARRTDLLERIARAAGNLDELIRELLEFSRLERGQLTLEPREVELGGLVGPVVDGLAAQLAGHPVDVDVSPGLVVRADPTALERVLTNLLTNATKFSEPGTPVSVSAVVGDGTVRIAVADRGVGIPPEELPRVTDRFFRASTARGRPGTGLGLAIVAELVAAMGGTVDITSTVGEGTTVTVTLPAAGPGVAGEDAGAVADGEPVSGRAPGGPTG